MMINLLNGGRPASARTDPASTRRRKRFDDYPAIKDEGVASRVPMISDGGCRCTRLVSSPGGDLITGSSVVIVPDEIVTAAELERMSPSDRQDVFEASLMTNLDDAPAELVARARARVEERIATSESGSR